VTAEAEWMSTDKRVATVAGGKITALAAGRTTIVATYGGKMLTVQVTVK
ncbi:hypothetical protein EN829_056830, partial [Mesorhizobium sp. M00.F.Ca.ET.186.01.1.1]